MQDIQLLRTESKQLLRLDDVMDQLSISRAGVERLVKEGWLRPIRIGRSVRYSMREVESLPERLAERQPRDVA